MPEKTSSLFQIQSFSLCIVINDSALDLSIFHPHDFLLFLFSIFTFNPCKLLFDQHAVRKCIMLQYFNERRIVPSGIFW